MISAADKKIIIDDFKGLYARGSVDEVPLDHAQDLLNTYSSSDGRIATRDGFKNCLSLGYASGGVRRFFLMEALPTNDRQPSTGAATNGSGMLLLDKNTNFYIGDNSAPFYSQQYSGDFCAINAGNRTYFCGNNGASGFRQGRLQVLNSFTGVNRDAAGPSPVQTTDNNFTAVDSGTDGDVPKGTHKIAVVYETDTGFWTQPGPKYRQSCTITRSTAATEPTIVHCSGHGCITGESHQILGGTRETGDNGGVADWQMVNDCWHITRIDDDHFSIPFNSFDMDAPTGSITLDSHVQYATLDAVGGKKITLGGIPTGPTYVKRRIILATRADEEEFFFVPNNPGSMSEIPDNTTTAVDINFADTDLVASADYLFDILEVIPGGSGINKYRGRLVIAGAWYPGNEERVLLSNVNDYETFNYVSGYVQVQTENDGNNVNTIFTLRDTLYLCKFTGIFATEDNGSDPSSWAISVVDAIAGCYHHGVSQFTLSQPASDTGDVVVLASKAGLYLFDGVIRRPELSWKIADFWARINFNFFFKVTIAHDPWNKIFYISVPLDTATEPNVILVCNYSRGRDAQNVVWHIWSPQKNPTCLGMAYFGSNLSTTKYALRMGSIDSSAQKVFELVPGQTNDDGVKIVSYYIPGPVVIDPGSVNCHKLLNFRAWGIGTMTLTVAKEDGSGSYNPPALTLTGSPARDYQRQINFMNEKMTFKFASGTSIDDHMTIDRIDVWGLMIWPIRPSV